MERLLLEYDTAATLESVAELRRLMQQVLISSLQQERLSHRILLCLSEALTNVVEHARPAASRLGLRFEQERGHWRLTLIDDGGYHAALAQQQPQLHQADQLAESGRGLGLLKASCDDIDYRRHGEENHLVFRWPGDPASSRARILLVEDDAAMRALLQSYLQPGYEVITAGNGNEVLELLRETSVDLVLSDINMPQMDGLELRSKLIQQDETELVPFIFITGSEDNAQLEKATSLGIDDYIIKPVARDRLINHVERVLQRSRQIVHKLGRRLDRKISESFLPRVPARLGGWKTAFASRSSGHGGGDFLLHHGGRDRSLIGLFDMMGHDETAKFFSYAYGGFIGGLMRGGVDESADAPGILKSISDLAHRDELLSKISLTGMVAELRPGGRIRLASGAHPHPLVLGAAAPEPIRVEGILPGILPDSEFEPVELELGAGQRVALYTDGLFESGPDNESRAELEQKIKAAMHDTRELPIDRALRMIMHKFDAIAGAPPRDDTTLVLLEPDTHG